MSDFKVETKCLHSGYTPSKGEPCALPIYQSTTYKYDTTDEMGQLFDLKAEGYFYTRLQNPTNDAVAAKIADLEGGVAAILTSSGQAANFYAVFNICEAGDHVVAASTIYGGTFNLLAVTFKKLGIDCTFVDTDASPEEIAAAFQSKHKSPFRRNHRKSGSGDPRYRKICQSCSRTRSSAYRRQHLRHSCQLPSF